VLPDIITAKSGKVLVNGWDGVGFGNYIVIKQDDGDYAIYGHMQSTSKNVNDIVKRGEKIGKQGQTGNGGGVDHLHFEVISGSAIGHSGCNTNFSGCYSYSTNNNYKVIPQFDECFSYRGGADENECKEVVNGSWVNAGYPVLAQSYSIAPEGRWYTSINNKFGKYAFRRAGTNQCIDINNPGNETPLVTWECFYNQNQTWEGIPSPYGGTMFERLNTLKCMDAWSPYDGRIVYTWDCYLPAQNHNWYYDGSTKQLKQRNTNFCIERTNPSNGTTLYTKTCGANKQEQQWDAIWIS
jgi:Peptidase family M23/Ricin-type beta-trefoil lectin domain